MKEPQRWEGRRIWIIGASSGIGASLAKELARRGAEIVISARRADRLAQVSRDAMTCVPLDVTSHEELTSVWPQVIAGGPLDLVVYCAGYWKQAPVGSFDAAEFDRHQAVHLGGLGRVLELVVPHMTARRRGQIAVVASPAGFRGLPGGEYYGSVKAAQLNLVEALGGSLARKGVTVTSVAPGFVATEMTASNSFKMPLLMQPDDAARHIADGLGRPRAEISFPLPVALGMKALRVLPSSLWRLVASRLRDDEGG